MPPPKASTEGHRDRQVSHETGQLVRALEAVGPCTPDELGRQVGAQYWEAGRFDRALAFLGAHGRAVRAPDGRLHACL
jgi:hypothetical protein